MHVLLVCIFADGNPKDHHSSTMTAGCRSRRKGICAEANTPVNTSESEASEHLQISKRQQQQSEKQYQCRVCEKTFVCLTSLQHHIGIHTGGKPRKNFSVVQHLKSDTGIHTERKPYQCKVCNKYFSQSQYLKSHRHVHTGDKPYQCKICRKSFIQSSNLQQHLQIHTGEKPYQCKICSKCFIGSGNLQRHL